MGASCKSATLALLRLALTMLRASVAVTLPATFMFYAALSAVRGTDDDSQGDRIRWRLWSAQDTTFTTFLRWRCFVGVGTP